MTIQLPKSLAASEANLKSWYSYSKSKQTFFMIYVEIHMWNEPFSLKHIKEENKSFNMYRHEELGIPASYLAFLCIQSSLFSAVSKKFVILLCYYSIISILNLLRYALNISYFFYLLIAILNSSFNLFTESIFKSKFS